MLENYLFHSPYIAFMTWQHTVEQFDWAQTPLGPRDRWSQSLQTTVDIVLASAFPMIVLWGDDLIQIYNQGYAVILGSRHPAALGQPAQDTWAEVWHNSVPIYTGVRQGKTYFFENQLYPITRNGTLEEAYFTLCYSPVRDDQGQIGGILVTGSETTSQVLVERELQSQKDIAESRNRTFEAFEEWSRDLTLGADPYALIDRAQQLLHSLLPTDVMVYYERFQEAWFVKLMQGTFGNEELRQAHERGLPHATTANIRIPFETQQPYYQGNYDPDTDRLTAETAHVTATAMLPLCTERGVQGIFGLARYAAQGWTSAERSLIETVTHSLGLALDRTQKAADLEVERAALHARSLELAAANEELEAFTYSASHDLRTPVRHVDGFADLTLRALEQGDQERARRHIGVIKEAANRMTNMIDALLILSRVGRVELHLRPMPLAVLVERAQQDGLLEFPDQDVVWEVSALPVVQGDARTLQQVMTNLVSNAVKYSQDRRPAQIRIWAEERPGEIAVLVQDNGVGFDPQYGDKLFGAFQRLHLQKEFAGTGIGLATVRRIVTRHGGEVWAEGAVGRGATFGFTLPR